MNGAYRSFADRHAGQSTPRPFVYGEPSNPITADQLDAMRADMLATETAREDARSQRRNRNRILVLVCGITGSTGWPLIMACTTHSAMLATFGAPIGFSAALVVTAYAWVRRY